MNRLLACAIAVGFALAIATAPQAAGQASRTRPSGASSGSPTRASGTATYRHHSGYHGGYGHYHGGYSGYAAPWWYYGWPAWGWGAWYAAPSAVGARSAPGVIETDVRPGRAVVRVDGAAVGEARDFNGRWDLLQLEPGDHVVELARSGYRTLRVHVQLAAGGYERIHARLDKGEGLDPRSTEAPPPHESPANESAFTRGMLRFDVAPDDAVVYLDGEFLARAGELGRLHGAVPVAGGRHLVEVVRPGFESASTEIDVAGGDTPVRIEIVLRRN